jgi:Kef-type K+ transport system membrane component KefB
MARRLEVDLTPSGFESLVIVVAVAALAPILVDLLPGRVRLPQVVLLLVAGILVGPSGWVGEGRPGLDVLIDRPGLPVLARRIRA